MIAPTLRVVAACMTLRVIGRGASRLHSHAEREERSVEAAAVTVAGQLYRIAATHGH